ncbi:10777_t:CDS:2, partial [Entrophospora sp. SA101]
IYIESFIIDLDVDGVYRVFPFMKSILPIDKPSIVSLSPTLAHLIALHEHVAALAEDYRSGPKYFTPSRRSSYNRKSLDSPQIKNLMK